MLWMGGRKIDVVCVSCRNKKKNARRTSIYLFSRMCWRTPPGQIKKWNLCFLLPITMADMPRYYTLCMRVYLLILLFRHSITLAVKSMIILKYGFLVFWQTEIALRLTVFAPPTKYLYTAKAHNSQANWYCTFHNLVS